MISQFRCPQRGHKSSKKVCGIAACFTPADDVCLFSKLPRFRIAAGDGERMSEPGDGSLSHSSTMLYGLSVACIIPCCLGRLEEMGEQTVPETLLTQL